MEKVAKEILRQYLSDEQISKVEDSLWTANCLIFHSKLPRISEQAILYVDGTPDDDYPLRILRVYRQHCNCQWVLDTDGEGEVTNPLHKLMNETNVRRAEILDKAISVLEG